ncbi:MAG: ABC transporter permease [Caldilineaceae bacterium]|nr:ABC transporter permease [Caldilineaceae bacterium]MBP8107425.1 ABC transporter permease [Caldilineaceae bacterium]MBP8123360.1 ABC transporter permease [Caldilineaceae bacterium]MBP9070968.1 ABC transporter permease [Caldilineaceae bacterium]
MQTFLTKRLLALVPTLLGVSLVVFVVIHLIPGDTISAMIGTTYKLTETQAAALRAYFGLDRPLHEQYVRWILSALRGDLGYSVRSGQPVLTEILSRFPVTLELTLFSLIIALVLGIPIGVLSAIKNDSAIDIFGRLFALVGLALPNFWLGTLFILILSSYFGIMPNSGDFVAFTVDPLRNLTQLLFPAITLGFAFTASVMRTTRSAMLEVMRQDYVRTARSKGVAELWVIVKHCLPNALIPVITIVGVEFGYLLGGAVIVEEVFALPGIGRLLLNGINQRDYAVVQGTILFIALNFVLINLLVDLTYAQVDPRIRYEE